MEIGDQRISGCGYAFQKDGGLASMAVPHTQALEPAAHYRVHQVATYLGLRSPDVLGLIYRGDLPARRAGVRPWAYWVVRGADVLRFAARYRRAGP